MSSSKYLYFGRDKDINHTLQVVFNRIRKEALCGGACRQGNQGPACNNGPVAPPPLWSPASQNRIPSRGSPGPPAIPHQSSSRWGEGEPGCVGVLSGRGLPSFLLNHVYRWPMKSGFCLWSHVICVDGVSTSEPGGFLCKGKSLLFYSYVLFIHSFIYSDFSTCIHMYCHVTLYL